MLCFAYFFTSTPCSEFFPFKKFKQIIYLTSFIKLKKKYIQTGSNSTNKHQTQANLDICEETTSVNEEGEANTIKAKLVTSSIYRNKENLYQNTTPDFNENKENRPDSAYSSVEIDIETFQNLNGQVKMR